MTVELIKKEIAEIFGYHRTTEFDIISEGRLLLNKDTVRACGIREGIISLLSVAEQLPCKLSMERGANSQ